MSGMHSSPSRPRRLLLALASTVVLAPLVAHLDAAESEGNENEVVVVISAESSVTEMSRLHLADLYLGRTSRFPNGEPAEPIDQEPGSPDREAFYETYLGRSPAEIKAHWSKIIFTGRGRPPKDAQGSEEIKELVANDPQAIGYIARDLVDDSVRVVQVK